MRLLDVSMWMAQRTLGLVRRNWPDITILAFVVKGTQWYNTEVGYLGIKVETPIDEDGFKWYREAWFSAPHAAIKVDFPDKTLLVGFWGKTEQQYKDFCDWLAKECGQNEPIGHSAATERILLKPFGMEGTDGDDTAR